MSRKLIAVLAVLMMIVAPLAVVGYSEATAVDAEDNITLDNLLTPETANNYWVKASIVNDVITLSNNTGKTAGGELTLSYTKSTENTVVNIGADFTIPAGKTIIAYNNLKNVDALPLTVNNNLTVLGTIAGNLYIDASTLKDKVITITFKGANIGIDSDEKGRDTPCAIYVDDQNTEEMKLVFNNTIINELYVYERIGVSPYYKGIYMENLNAKDVKMNCVITSPKNAVYGWDIKGGSFTKASVGTEAVLELGCSESQTLMSNSEGYNFDNLVLSDLTLKLHYKCTQSINIYDDRSIIDYSSCRLECKANVFSLIKCGTDDVKMLILDYYGSGSSKDEGQIVYTAIDKTGIAGYFNVNTVATEGIASIDSRINFVSMEEGVIDLTAINVTCEAGYKFVGWYYMDANGVMCKIMNPAQVLVTDNMTVYAVAEKELPAPEQKDYTLWFVLVSVLLVVLILAVFLMAFMRSNASSASAAKPARKTSKRK